MASVEHRPAIDTGTLRGDLGASLLAAFKLRAVPININFRYVEREPSYGMASRFLFLLFMGYERLVNSTRMLKGFRVNLFGVYRKVGAG